MYDGKRILGFGGTDHDHVREATRRNAILVSFDKDFRVDSDLRTIVSASPGVILIQSTKANLNDVHVIITRVLRKATPHQFTGKVCSASLDAIRFA